MKTFFWFSPKFGEKSVLVLIKTFFFFGLHLNLGNSVSFAIFLVFTKFPNLNQIVVEVHPPMLKIGQNWGKIANYPPQCSTKIGTTVLQPPESQP